MSTTPGQRRPPVREWGGALLALVLASSPGCPSAPAFPLPDSTCTEGEILSGALETDEVLSVLRVGDESGQSLGTSLRSLPASAWGDGVVALSRDCATGTVQTALVLGLDEQDDMVVRASPGSWLTNVMGVGDPDGDARAELVVAFGGPDGEGVALLDIESSAEVSVPDDVEAVTLLEGIEQVGAQLDISHEGTTSLLAIGAPGAETGGRLYLVPLSALDVSNSLDDFPFIRGSEEVHIGTSLAFIGDLDGDGLEELAVGDAGFTRGDQANTGAVAVLPGAQLLAGVDPTSANRVTGTAANSFCGRGLARAGDLTGDGVPDLAMSCRAPDGVLVRVVSGSTLLDTPEQLAAQSWARTETFPGQRVALAAAAGFERGFLVGVPDPASRLGAAAYGTAGSTPNGEMTPTVEFGAVRGEAVASVPRSAGGAALVVGVPSARE